jgi:hypothetical protein
VDRGGVRPGRWLTSLVALVGRGVLGLSFPVGGVLWDLARLVVAPTLLAVARWTKRMVGVVYDWRRGNGLFVIVGSVAAVLVALTVATTTTIAGNAGSGGTDWVEITAIATCVTALGLLAAAAAAFWAGQQVRESERSRNAEMATHMFDEWGRAELAGARDAVHRAGRAETRRCYSAAWDGRGSEDEQKVRKAADTIMIFFEELGIMELEGGLGLSWIQLTMGGSVQAYWAALEPSIRDLRLLNDQPTAYENFEVLTYRLSKAPPPKSTRKARRKHQQMPTTTT